MYFMAFLAFLRIFHYIYFSFLAFLSIFSMFKKSVKRLGIGSTPPSWEFSPILTIFFNPSLSHILYFYYQIKSGHGPKLTMYTIAQCKGIMNHPHLGLPKAVYQP